MGTANAPAATAHLISVWSRGWCVRSEVVPVVEPGYVREASRRSNWSLVCGRDPNFIAVVDALAFPSWRKLPWSSMRDGFRSICMTPMWL